MTCRCQHAALSHRYAHGVGNVGACLVCECGAYGESGQTCLGIRDVSVVAWENEGNEKCPEPARTDPGRRPHPAKESVIA